MKKKRIPRKWKKELKKLNPWIKKFDKEYLASFIIARDNEHFQYLYNGRYDS